jgi:CheY-like chemotaxis protein
MQGKVLVVEDDPDIRNTVIDVLDEVGISALGAPNGRAALDLLRNTLVPPRLILLDLMMPVMDGRTFREVQLRMPELRDIPVVLMSAFRELEAEAKSLAAAGFLKKPLRLEELREPSARFCAA